MKTERAPKATKKRLKEEAARVFGRVYVVSYVSMGSRYKYKAIVGLVNFHSEYDNASLVGESDVSEADARQRLLDVLAVLPSRAVFV